MFYKESVLNKLTKQSFKGAGVHIGKTESGWLYVAGGSWCVCHDSQNIPPEYLGDLIKVVKNIPATGEAARVCKDGKHRSTQIEMIFPHNVLPERFGDQVETATRCTPMNILVEIQDKKYRMVDAGPEAYLVQDIYCQVPDPEKIDYDNGETEIQGPYLCKGEHSPLFIWFNDDTWYAAAPLALYKGDETAGQVEALAAAFGMAAWTIEK
ncbi:MAG: hypothetical protein IJ899_04045 [Blautia sp.]|nr:hypothetical protein [Blautia sp.]